MSQSHTTSKIPCPSCGEMNFEKTPLCWKCGASLRERPTPPMETKPQSPPQDPPVDTQVQPSEVMDAVIAMETQELTRSRNLLYAAVLASIFAAGFSFLVNTPFHRWLDATSFPISAGKGYMIWSALSAAAVAYYSAYSRRGPVVGAAAYVLLLLVYRLYALWTCAVVPPVVAPLYIVDFHQLAGIFALALVLLASWFVSSKIGRKPEYPFMSPRGVLRTQATAVKIAAGVLAVSLTVSWFAYKSAMKTASSDATRTVGGYCWRLSKGQGDLKDVLTDVLATRMSMDPKIAEQIRPSCKLPSLRSAKLMILGKKKPKVSYEPGGKAAMVTLTVMPDGSWLPDAWRMPEELEGAANVDFSLSREGGKWLISQPPTVSYSGL